MDVLGGGGYLSELLNSDMILNEKALIEYDVKNTASQIDRVYGLL